MKGIWQVLWKLLSSQDSIQRRTDGSTDGCLLRQTNKVKLAYIPFNFIEAGIYENVKILADVSYEYMNSLRFCRTSMMTSKITGNLTVCWTAFFVFCEENQSLTSGLPSQPTSYIGSVVHHDVIFLGLGHEKWYVLYVFLRTWKLFTMDSLMISQHWFGHNMYQWWPSALKQMCYYSSLR